MITTPHQLGIHTTPILVSLLGCVSIVESAVAFQHDSLTHLIEAVESAEAISQEAALIEIRELGREAKDAVQPICKLLSSDSFSLRALSVDALVAIGKPSIEPVRHLLNSDSASARAAAIQCLSSLNASSFPDLKRLADDKSERVRASVAIGLSNCKHPESDSLLIQLLDDSKTSVCVQACLAFQNRKTNPKTVVPALTRNLDRINAAAVIIDTLGGFGTDAQSAIPKMLEMSSDLKEWDEHFDNPIDKALLHIGPPNPADAKKIGSLLLGAKDERNIRIAKSLFLLGREGSAAADDLERVIDEMLQRYAEFDPESPRFDKNNSKLEDWQLEENVVNIEHSITDCVATLWVITGDTKRFMRLIKKISLASKYAIFFYSETPWKTFSNADILEIKTLLDSKDSRIISCGLSLIEDIGERTHVLIDDVIRLHEGETFDDKSGTLGALAVMGQRAPERVFPIILKEYRRKSVTLKELVKLLKLAGACPPEFRTILYKRVKNSWFQIPHEVADFLCESCKNKKNELDQTSQLLLKEIDDGQLRRNEAVRAFQLLPNAQEDVIEFYIQCLDPPNEYAAFEAIDALAELGSDAQSAVPLLREFLNLPLYDDKTSIVKTIYQIDGDEEAFREFLDSEFKKEDEDNRHSKCLTAIIELGPRGVPFQEFIFENQQRFWSGRIDDFCEILKNLASDQSIAKLKEFSKSKDWKIQSAARSALNKLAKTKAAESSK